MLINCLQNLRKSPRVIKMGPETEEIRFFSATIGRRKSMFLGLRQLKTLENDDKRLFCPFASDCNLPSKFHRILVARVGSSDRSRMIALLNLNIDIGLHTDHRTREWITENGFDLSEDID